MLSAKLGVFSELGKLSAEEVVSEADEPAVRTAYAELLVAWGISSADMIMDPELT